MIDSDSKRHTAMWSPSAIDFERSQLLKWSSSHGIDNVADFHHWSVEYCDLFWAEAVERLSIRFRKKDRVLELPGNRDEGPGSNRDSVWPDASWFPDSRLNIVESCLLGNDDGGAIVFGGVDGTLRRQSLGELGSLTARTANSLRNLGLSPGDAVGVVLPMTAQSVAIYLGIVAAGMQVISIADSFSAEEIRMRLEMGRAKAVFTYDYLVRAGKRLPLFERVARAASCPIITCPLGEKVDVEIGDKYIDWKDFLVADDEFSPTIVASSAAVNILFSSGTTGQPKAIPWTQLTPIKCAVDAMLLQNVRAGSVVAWPTNLGWMMGPWLIFAALLNRATIALFEDAPMGQAFGKFVQDANVSMLGVVPTIVRSWRAQGCMEAFDWSAIECFSSTGEASQAEDMIYLSKLAGGKPVIEYCGGTEIGGGYISSTMIQPNYPSTFSTVAFGLDMKIRDEAGKPADEGEVFLVGPSIGLSQRLLNRDHDEAYFQGVLPDEDGTVLRRHGDFMRRLPDGYFKAGGRCDDTMNLGGIKISSAEIEQVLNSLDNINETAAVAFPGSGPQKLAVFYSVSPTGKSASPQEILDQLNGALRERLNPLFRVSEAFQVEQFPRTASNKVMRRALRDRLREQEP